MNKMKAVLLLISSLALFAACSNEAPTPKPYGYHRINYPERVYARFDSTNCPYSFEKSVASRFEPVRNAENPCWMNLYYPDLGATIYLSYKEIDGQESLFRYIDETQRMTYKHVVKASSIEEKFLADSANRIFGIWYEVGGEAASATQFYLTDSTNHFVRGSLYFYSSPRPDSLAPIVDYVLVDMRKMLESFRWK